MWANQEIADLVTWLKTYNAGQATPKQVGFYGLDVYSMRESVETILNNFNEADEATRQAARSASQCLAGFSDEQAYGLAASRGNSSCRNELTKLLEAIRSRAKQLPAGHEGVFNAEQNVLVALNAENYYRNMYASDEKSWNIRDEHMTQTINRLMAHQGSGAKIIVWEHNTHVGDARYTDMARSGMVNVGQLVREQHAGEGVHIVGFGTYVGSVIASSAWEGPTTKMEVPKAQPDSWEAILHQKGPADKIIDLKAWRSISALQQSRGHRAIGVVYNPGAEAGNYVPTDLANRYDSFLFIDKSEALHPLNVPARRERAPQNELLIRSE
jgi:erythromycin esterase-like protein